MLMEDNLYTVLVLFYTFFLFASLTVLNMLIGVLCEVVTAVAETEHLELQFNYVRDSLEPIVERCLKMHADPGEDLKISKQGFTIILEDSETASLFDEVGIDVLGLVDVVDTIFESEMGQEKVLSFGELVVELMEQ